MYLGVVTAAFASQSFDEALDAIVARGITAIEVPAGGYFPKTHCDPERLLAEPAALSHFRDAIAQRNLTLTALALHGNPLHPDPHRRDEYAREFGNTVVLAELLGLTRLTLLAGLPGGGPGESTPNWIVHPFPPELESMLRWQWEECILPHWRNAARLAADHGLKLCFEMVPADCVYHPRALVRLRTEIGPVIGCNFDPSHLFMQGIDPIEAIRILGDAIYHVHAKDARLEPTVVRTDGILDTLPYSAVRERAWIYRTVGYGHGEGFWRDFVSALRVVGYDDVVSIEHEDVLFAADEGLRKAVDLLQRVMPFAPLDDAGWWAVDAGR
jgi:sugar phosphate isomerase/epimerase